jgi:hypothetical protein
MRVPAHKHYLCPSQGSASAEGSCITKAVSFSGTVMLSYSRCRVTSPRAPPLNLDNSGGQTQLQDPCGTGQSIVVTSLQVSLFTERLTPLSVLVLAARSYCPEISPWRDLPLLTTGSNIRK